MAKQQFNSTNKVCATCEFWGGTRTTDLSRLRSVCDGVMAKGKCLNKLSGWANHPSRQANANCAKWQKWGALK